MAVTIKQLLEAGVHFGHQTRRWNPKMAPYIFTARNGIYIINLEKTEKAISAAVDFLRQAAARGGYVLFVGTKKQAQQIVIEEAQRCNMFFVDQRWLGGTLTNFETVRKSVHRMDAIDRMREDGTFDKLKKKEVSMLLKEMSKLEKNLGGIRRMSRLPAAVVVVDVKKEETAVREARRLNIPVVALVDTNSDPELVNYVIPGNDDAIKSIKLIVGALADAVADGAKSRKDVSETEPDAMSAEEKKKFIADEELEEEVRQPTGARKGKKTVPAAVGSEQE